MRTATIIVVGAALGLAASACWAQNAGASGALSPPVQGLTLSAQLAQATPAPRAHHRQALLVGGLRLGATQDPLARDVPPALERAGFAIHNSRNDPAAIVAAVRRLTATGVPAADIIVLARGAHSAAALEAAVTLALPALNLVLIDGCPSLIARGQTLPPAHILAIATSKMPTGESCGQAPEAGEGRPAIEFVRLTPAPAQRGAERTEPDALARAIAGWIAPPQFPDDAN